MSTTTVNQVAGPIREIVVRVVAHPFKKSREMRKVERKAALK